MARWVLKEGRTWKTAYVAKDNPLQKCDSIDGSRRFYSRGDALACKKALHLSRAFAARRLPDWL